MQKLSERHMAMLSEMGVDIWPQPAFDANVIEPTSVPSPALLTRLTRKSTPIIIGKTLDKSAIEESVLPNLMHAPTPELMLVVDNTAWNQAALCALPTAAPELRILAQILKSLKWDEWIQKEGAVYFGAFSQESDFLEACTQLKPARIMVLGLVNAQKILGEGAAMAPFNQLREREMDVGGTAVHISYSLEQVSRGNAQIKANAWRDWCYFKSRLN